MALRSGQESEKQIARNYDPAIELSSNAILGHLPNYPAELFWKGQTICHFSQFSSLLAERIYPEPYLAS
jgi:hypothetical protein